MAMTSSSPLVTIHLGRLIRGAKVGVAGGIYIMWHAVLRPRPGRPGGRSFCLTADFMACLRDLTQRYTDGRAREDLVLSPEGQEGL